MRIFKFGAKKIQKCEKKFHFTPTKTAVTLKRRHLGPRKKKEILFWTQNTFSKNFGKIRQLFQCKISQIKRSVFSTLNFSAVCRRIFKKFYMVKGLGKLFKKHLNHFPVFFTVWRIFAKNQKITPFFARKSPNIQPFNFSENCCNESLGP